MSNGAKTAEIKKDSAEFEPHRPEIACEGQRLCTAQRDQRGGGGSAAAREGPGPWRRASAQLHQQRRATGEATTDEPRRVGALPLNAYIRHVLYMYVTCIICIIMNCFI